MYYHYYFVMIAVILKIDWMLLLGLTSDWLLVLKFFFFPITGNITERGPID